MIKDWLRARVRCPQCLGDLGLSVEDQDGEIILRGRLHCAACGCAFPISMDMAFFGIKKSAAEARKQEMNAEFRWNFEMHGLDEHMAYAPTSFRMGLEAIRQLAALIPAQGMVLDVGAGCGYHAWQLAKHGYHAAAAELSPELLAYGDACFQPGVTFERIVTDCSLLPLADQSFDAVFCKETAHHIEDLPEVLGEFSRVLKPGGVLVLVEPCRPRRPGVKGWGDRARAAGLTHQDYGFRDYLRAVQRAGFRVVRLKSHRPPLPPARFHLLRVLDAVLAMCFRLDGWGGWQRLKRLRAHWLGGEVTLLARKHSAPLNGHVSVREVEIVPVARLEQLREAIETKRREVPGFLRIIEAVHREDQVDGG